MIRLIRDNLSYRIQSLGNVHRGPQGCLSSASMGNGLTGMFGNVQGF